MTFFTIDPGTDHVPLEKRAGSVVFSVQNKTGTARQVRAMVVADDPGQERWYTVREPVREARVDESVQFPVDVAVPEGAEAGAHGFRLRVVAEDDPDDVYQESQRLRVDVPESKPSPFPWWIVAVVAAVLLVAGVIGALLVTDDDEPPPPETVAIPEGLVGLSLENAETRLESAGLAVGDVSEEPSSEAPEGEVIDTDPDPGTEVDSGSAVDLTVSSGSPPVTVPDLVDLPQQDAETRLESAGLAVGDVSDEPSSEAPEGRVISQEPAGGTEVEADSPVDLTISAGPPPDPPVFSQGRLSVRQTFIIDLDAGTVDEGDDLWFEAETAERRFLSPRQGAQIALRPGDDGGGRVRDHRPNFSACRDAPLSSNRIAISRLSVGSHVCVRTNQGRLSDVEIVELPGPSPGTLTIRYTTWE